MTANLYQVMASRTINKELNDSELTLHALHGMVGEIGEISSIYQKVYQGHDLDNNHIKKEVGDLLWFVAEFCTCHDWTLDDVMELNIDKLMKRYPEGFTAENSLHRKEGDI